MKKMLIGVLFALATVAALADSVKHITFSLIYAPGSISDTQVTSLIPSLERDGFTVEKKYFKSCAAAVADMKGSSVNNFIMVVNGDVAMHDPSVGSKCPPNNSLQTPLSLYSGMAQIPILVCSTPQYGKMSIDDMFADTGKKLKFGFVNTKTAKLAVEGIFKNAPKLNAVPLPYGGNSELRTAILANDVDFYMSASLPKEMLAKGGNCVASSILHNAQKLPHVFGLTGDNSAVIDFSYHAILYNMGTVTPEVTKSMITAIKSSEHLNDLVRYGATHVGIASGEVAAKTVADLITVETKLGK